MWVAHYASSLSCVTWVMKCDGILFECSLYKLFHETFISFRECVNSVFAIALKKKQKKKTFLLFSWNSPIRMKESWNETAWIVHIKQVVERNTLNINMASLHMLTLHSFMLFKVWNVVNVREMNHENHNYVWQNKTSYVECSRCWQCIDSHTHKSNFMPFWFELSRTWKHAFHYWINLLCIKV